MIWTPPLSFIENNFCLAAAFSKNKISAVIGTDEKYTNDDGGTHWYLSAALMPPSVLTGVKMKRS